MSKREAFLSSLACFFIGIVVGFWFAPVKRGIYCGNNSGNSYGADGLDDCCCDDDYYDGEADLPF